MREKMKPMVAVPDRVVWGGRGKGRDGGEELQLGEAKKRNKLMASFLLIELFWCEFVGSC